jgi:hypothetical protein
MKLLQTVIGHVGLLLDVVRARVTQAVTAPRVTT